jgi:hypothetical protein
LANQLLNLMLKFHSTRLANQSDFEDNEREVMSSAIQVVKRKDREPSTPSCTANASSVGRLGSREIVRTVKTWMDESRDLKQAEAKLAFQFIRGFDVRNGFDSSTHITKSYLTTFFVIGLIILSAHGATRAQSPTPSTASLTLDRAIDLALRNNHAIKIAQFEVANAEEEISVAKTSRLPSLHMYTSTEPKPQLGEGHSRQSNRCKASIGLAEDRPCAGARALAAVILFGIIGGWNGWI